MNRVLTATLFTASLPLFAQQSPSTMPKLGTVSPRFQSYNIEMVEVIGGRFWKPYTDAPVKPPTSLKTVGIDPNLFEQRPPVNLADPQLRKLAAALGPAYVRVSGSWANNVYFHDSDAPAPATPPTGFGGVLTRAEWKSVIDFSRAVDAPIVTSFAVSMGTRDASGLWTTTEARKFIEATHQLGGEIAVTEFFNEPNLAFIADVPKGYDGPAYARDFAVFRTFLRTASPHTILVGPSGTAEGLPLSSMKLIPSADMLQPIGPNAVDGFSYHFYGTVSERCSAMRGPGANVSASAALSEDWLSRTTTVETFYSHLRDQYEPGKPMWLTETGQAACGGDRWAATFADTFRYLNQLGVLAQHKVQVVMHNTLDASDYGLLDSHTLTPRPNYWAALLWHNTMGTTVLDPGPSTSPTIHLFAHCMKNIPGGVTLLALNLNPTQAQTIKLPTASTRYTLTAPTLTSSTVDLNNRTLTLTSSGELPHITGTPTQRGETKLPPASITFFTIATANAPACTI